MSLVAAKCTQCGANITVDSSKDAGICPHCNTAYIVEKAIKNYNTTNNIQNQTNIYYGESEFEKEKKQCKVLLMLLNNMDLQYLKDRALKVMDTNPENCLAQMIYDCGFNVNTYNNYTFLEFNEQPLQVYLKKECGNIDAETSITFIKAIVLKMQTGPNLSEMVNIILKNISMQNIDSDALYNTYCKIADEISNVSGIESMLYVSKLRKVAGILTFFDESYNSTDDFDTSKDLKAIASMMLSTRRIMADVFVKAVNKSSLPLERKNMLIGKVSNLLRGASNSNSATNSMGSTSKQSDFISSNEEPEQKSKAGWVLLITVCIIVAIFAFYGC